MNKLLRLSGFLACMGLATMLSQGAMAQSAGQVPDTNTEAGPSAGQMEGPDALAAQGNSVEAGISSTQLTFKSHQIVSGGSGFNLQGNACPATFRMISGACHPGYNDRVIIINQFPNINANTWRCGFKNNTGMTRTVWIYTLCGK